MYPLPPLFTITSTIFPLEIIGVSCAPDPLFNVINGCFSKFNTSEDPYPTPLLLKCTDVILPLKIGIIFASNLYPFTDEMPVFSEISTEIFG